MGGSRKLQREELAASLGAFVAEREHIPTSAVSVHDLKPMGGGASRLLWSLDLEIDSADAGLRRFELVLRQDPPGRVVAGGMELEYALLREAAKAGVPVPAVHWCSGDGKPLGSPFLLMERLPGEAIPRRLLRDERYARARGVMIAQLGAILARIHTIDPEAPELARRLSGPTASESSGEAEVDRLMEAVRALSVEPHPVLDLTERWLRERLPRQRSGGLVHGDFRIGNVLFDEAGVVAILDWELAHLGDPVEDLAWLCVRAWRFGNDAQSAGGIGTREELVRAYESAGGGAVDPAVLRFWEVCGNLKLALVFITQARVHLDGGHRSIELASLGRRTAEAEEEMLRLMEGGG